MSFRSWIRKPKIAFLAIIAVSVSTPLIFVYTYPALFMETESRKLPETPVFRLFQSISGRELSRFSPDNPHGGSSLKKLVSEPVSGEIETDDESRVMMQLRHEDTHEKRNSEREIYKAIKTPATSNLKMESFVTSDYLLHDKVLSWAGDPIKVGTPHWQRLDKNNDAFVYSAHYDDIDTPFDDVNHTGIIRVVGLARRPLQYSEVWCRFYQEGEGAISGRVRGKLYHFRYRGCNCYVGAFVDCPLTKDNPFPFAVAVEKDYVSSITTFLKVHYSQQYSPYYRSKRSDTISKNKDYAEHSDLANDSFLHKAGQEEKSDIRNDKNSYQRSRKDRTEEDTNAVEADDNSVNPDRQLIDRHKTYDINDNSAEGGRYRWNITRCFPAFQRRYGEHVRLAEMVAASRVLGVDRFVFYVETVTPEVRKLLQMLQDDGLAEVYPWNLHLAAEEVHYLGQFMAIQDCLYRHQQSSRYLLFGDVDELFVPRGRPQLLPLLEEQFTKNSSCGAFLFRNVFFDTSAPLQLPPLDDLSSDFLRKHRMPMLQHVTRDKSVLHAGDRSKPVVDPRKVSVGSVHVVLKFRNGFKSCMMPPKNGLLHHYRSSTYVSKRNSTEDVYLWRFAGDIVKETRRILNAISTSTNGITKAVLPVRKSDPHDLARLFTSRLPDAETEIPKLPNCAKMNTSHTCINQTCPTFFSLPPEVRLRQILSTRTQAYNSHLPAVASLLKNVSSFKYIFASAVSSNHYNELQRLVKNLVTNMFPRVENYTFLLFDLGLGPFQRNLTEKHCRCTVVDFPFHLLPPFFKKLKCFSWKPFIIRSLIDKAKFVIWMDSSIHWSGVSPLEPLFQRAKEHGLQLRQSQFSMSLRTGLQMFKFYKDLPCQYSSFAEIESGVGIYHNDQFVREAVLDPWVSCAFDTDCMCVDNFKKLLGCSNVPPRRDGQCHRFDQSSLAVIVSKLFLHRRGALILPPASHSVLRGQMLDWFKDGVMPT